MWQHPCLPNIIVALISDKNPEGNLTNSYLEVSSLVLHEATLLDTCPEAKMAAPHLGSDNMPTVSWNTQDASTINPVVADLLHICMLHSRQFFSILWSSTTQARKIAWWMTHLASLIYLTPRFLPTCPSPTRSRKFRGNSSPCRRNYFHALSLCCAGSCAIRNYTGCVPTENVPALGRLMLYLFCCP